MRTLTKLQIDLIRGDIRQSGVEMRELEDDLLDHICCAIETEEGDSSFENIYQHVKKTIFPEGYREIQQKTTYLLTLKYKKMKKIMNISGITGSLMLLVGSIMKVLHLMGANEALLLGGIVLVLGYLPLMLILSMKYTDTISGKVRNISGYVGASAIIIGVVFNILHFYPAKILMLGGIGVFIIVFLPLLLKSVGKDLVMKINPITSAVIILALVSILFAFNNKRSSHSYRNSLAELNNNASRAFNYKYERLQGLRITNPEDSKLIKASDETIQYIAGLKEQFFDVYNIENNTDELPGFDVILDFNRHEDFTLYNSPEFIYTGEELYQKVKNFHNILTSQYPELKTPILETEENQNWVETHFLNTPMVSAYTYLSQLQLEIADLEIEALRK